MTSAPRPELSIIETFFKFRTIFLFLPEASNPFTLLAKRDAFFFS